MGFQPMPNGTECEVQSVKCGRRGLWPPVSSLPPALRATSDERRALRYPPSTHLPIYASTGPRPPFSLARPPSFADNTPQRAPAAEAPRRAPRTRHVRNRIPATTRWENAKTRQPSPSDSNPSNCILRADPQEDCESLSRIVRTDPKRTKKSSRRDCLMIEDHQEESGPKESSGRRRKEMKTGDSIFRVAVLLLLGAILIVQCLLLKAIHDVRPPTLGDLRKAQGAARRELYLRRPMVEVSGSVRVD